jgi:ribosome-binding factor A
MKFTPSIAFYLDETLDRVEHIEQLLRKIHQDEPKASGGTGESES